MARKATDKKTTNNPHEVTGWEPFALPGIDVQLRRAITEKRRPGTPAVLPGYVFREDLVRDFATAVWPADGGAPLPLVMSGPKGTGKTSFVEQIAAHCNIPVYRTNLHVGTTVRQLKGRVGAVSGVGTVFVPGIATMAMEIGAWLLLDEISGVTPPVALSLFPIMETDGSVLLEDAQPPRYVKRHESFRVFGTDNTLGAHMETRRFSYAGTNPDMNEALLDRFTGGILQVEHLSPEAEYKAVVAEVPTIAGDNLKSMIAVANNLRGSNEFTGGFSIRMLKSWARLVSMGYLNAKGEQIVPKTACDGGENDAWILHCAVRAFISKQSNRANADAMEEVIRRSFIVDGI